jgi:hypothetical protein
LGYEYGGDAAYRPRSVVEGIEELTLKVHVYFLLDQVKAISFVLPWRGACCGHECISIVAIGGWRYRWSSLEELNRSKSVARYSFQRSAENAVANKLSMLGQK